MKLYKDETFKDMELRKQSLMGGLYFLGVWGFCSVFYTVVYRS